MHDIYQIDCASIWNLENQHLVRRFPLITAPISSTTTEVYRCQWPSRITWKPCKPAVRSTHNAMRDPARVKWPETCARGTSTPCSTPASASMATWSACYALSKVAAPASGGRRDRLCRRAGDQFLGVISSHNRAPPPVACTCSMSRGAKRQCVPAGGGQLRRRGGIRQLTFDRDG